ncbi:MAG: hypothetical protein P8X79_05775, partial [Reinekea sp.]
MGRYSLSLKELLSPNRYPMNAAVYDSHVVPDCYRLTLHRHKGLRCRHKKRPPKRPFSCNHFMAHLRRQITLLDDLRYNA